MTRRLQVGAGAVIALVAAYMLVTGLQWGGGMATEAVEDYGQAAAAIAAAALCFLAAARTSARLRLGWLFMALSATSWALGELYWAVSEVNLGVPVPFPSLADAGFLAAIPLAAAGLLAFPFGRDTGMGRLRAVLDGLIVATSLAYVGWSVGIGTLEGQEQLGVAGGLFVLAYPAGDIALLTIIAMSARLVASHLRPLLALLALVFAANLVADSSFAYLNLGDQYGPLGGTLDAGWVLGYLTLGLAATWRVPRAAVAIRQDSINIWDLTMPWVAVLAVLVTSVWVIVTGRVTGAVAGALGCAMGVPFLVSQFLTLNDSLRLLVRSRRAEADLRERTALLTEVIGRAPLGIARFSADLRFIDANPRLSEMLGVPAVALVGAPLDQFLSAPEAIEAHKRTALMVQGSLGHFELDTEMRCADGTTFWAHRRITPVTKADGQFHYCLVMFEDISEKHAIEEATRVNVAELERINRLKSEFMSMVSHEFRTALTGIQGYSEVMTTDEVEPQEVKAFSGDINSEAMRLNRMITEMLDLDRMESGRVILHVEPVDLNAVITEAVERARMGATRHDIELSLNPSVPRVNGDRDRLTQAVTNLLSNAVKYSPEGSKVVVATRLVDGNVEVSVQDQGQGIPAEFISRIFGRYERYEGPGQAAVVGTGLGLAITQQIVQLHSGRIWVESSVGAGSTFRFTIPAPALVGAARVA